MTAMIVGNIQEAVRKEKSPPPPPVKVESPSERKEIMIEYDDKALDEDIQSELQIVL